MLQTEGGPHPVQQLRCARTSPAEAGSLQNYRSVIQFLGIQEMIRWRPKQRLN